ncbi:hypothetical protein K502DRAFT_247545 [Neoconidiobolus thromboides FSU 785]|nr:hypothetical protein K502DRAFT_247545 [Neoconidiobolus thromboides FSU 785]
MKGKRDKKAPVKRLKDVLYGPKDSNSFLDDVNRGLVFRSKFENTSQLVQEEPAVKNPLPGVPFHLQDHTVIVDADEIAKANVYKRSLFREPTSTKGTLQKENTIKTQYNLNKVKARRKKKELKDVIYNNQQENPNNIVNKAELSKKNDGFEDNDPEKRVKVIEEILKRNNGFNPIKNLNQNESEVFGTKVNSYITKESQLFQNKNVDRDVRETDNTNRAINKTTNLTSNTTANQKKKEDKGKKGNQIEVLNIFDSENEEENLNAKGSVASQNNRSGINSDLINTNGNQHEIANNMNQEISTFDQQNVGVFNNQNMEVYNPSNNQPNYENKEAVYRADEFYSLPPRRPDIWYSPFPVDPQANLGDFDFAPGEEVDNEHISTDQYDNLQSENPYQQSPGDLFSLEQPYFNTPTQHDNHADLREVRYQYDIEGGNKVGHAEIGK